MTTGNCEGYGVEVYLRFLKLQSIAGGRRLHSHLSNLEVNLIVCSNILLSKLQVHHLQLRLLTHRI